MDWKIRFLKEKQFKDHIRKTINQYGDKLKPCNIAKLNSNLIYPIKMVFDKSVCGWSWEELVSSEIFRQRNKAITNDIGYFHQRIFEYIADCHVPNNREEGGWDVIVDKANGYAVSEGNVVHKIFVEMKNKHNTMNSASAVKTYIKMQHQLLQDDDCACFLVEAIAKKHQNIIWQTSVDRIKVSHKRIRRVSLDSFYEVVTGEADAFYQICKALPIAVQEVLVECDDIKIPKDSVFAELKERAKEYPMETEDLSILMAVYMLGFGSYTGFNVER